MYLEIDVLVLREALVVAENGTKALGIYLLGNVYPSLPGDGKCFIAFFRVIVSNGVLDVVGLHSFDSDTLFRICGVYGEG